MRWLCSAARLWRRAWWLLLLGGAAASLPLATVATAPGLSGASATPPGQDRNLGRALATYQSLQQHFGTGAGRLRETYPPPEEAANATLWPFSQALVGVLLVSPLTDQGDVAATLPRDLTDGLGAYWDAGATPPGYAASMLPPLGGGGRKFFDDNAWAGLALVQAARRSGDPVALARARQAFDFVVSGWDDDPTHPDPGGVWWSQAMPNPRFRHRNTVSTAAGAELGLQLYEASGRAEPRYRDWATRMYTWVDSYLRGPNGLYGDHVDLDGVVDGGQLTYNQGTMVGASVLLYRVTGEADYLARARAIADTSLATFGADGFGQAPAYNAVFFRNLLLLEEETGDGRYRAAMQTYADRMWDARRDPASGLFDVVYGRSRTTTPHRLLDQGAMLQVYAALALGPSVYRGLT